MEYVSANISHLLPRVISAKLNRKTPFRFCQEHHTKLSYHQNDVTDAKGVQSVFDKVKNQSRYPLRGLVTCAGISERSLAIDYSANAFRRILDINVIGTFLCAQAAARVFHECGVSGSIVMLASVSGSVVNQV